MKTWAASQRHRFKEEEASLERQLQGLRAENSLLRGCIDVAHQHAEAADHDHNSMQVITLPAGKRCPLQCAGCLLEISSVCVQAQLDCTRATVNLTDEERRVLNKVVGLVGDVTLRKHFHISQVRSSPDLLSNQTCNWIALQESRDCAMTLGQCPRCYLWYREWM